MDYYKYQHVERLGRSSTYGILDGKVYVFPKLDGTNAHCWFDGEMHYGSRRRELSLDNDNAGFMGWAAEQYKLTEICTKAEGWHVYGEWLVPHTLKSYREDAWRHFYIFDIVHPENGQHMKYEDVQALMVECGWDDYIAPLRILINPSPDDVLKCLDENDYLVEYGVGEGVVCKNYEYRNQFGNQTWAKVIDSEFKAKHRKTMGAPVSKCAEMIEPQIVEQFLTKAMIDKVEANIISSEVINVQDEYVAASCWEGKFIPRLLGTVWHDFITEELFDALKKFKNPKIDFKYLNRLTTERVKELRNDLF